MNAASSRDHPPVARRPTGAAPCPFALLGQVVQGERDRAALRHALDRRRGGVGALAPQVVGDVEVCQAGVQTGWRAEVPPAHDGAARQGRLGEEGERVPDDAVRPRAGHEVDDAHAPRTTWSSTTAR